MRSFLTVFVKGTSHRIVVLMVLTFILNNTISTAICH